MLKPLCCAVDVCVVGHVQFTPTIVAVVRGLIPGSYWHTAVLIVQLGTTHTQQQRQTRTIIYSNALVKLKLGEFRHNSVKARGAGGGAAIEACYGSMHYIVRRCMPSNMP